MADTFVQWTGLTELIADLEEHIPRRASRDLAVLNEEYMETVLQFYQDNLAGAEPSTEAWPLPVGMQSGELYEGARGELVNQHNCVVYNDDPKAGWIEDGTKYIAPRRPLQDAVETVEKTLDVQLDEVLVGIIEG